MMEANMMSMDVKEGIVVTYCTADSSNDVCAQFECDNKMLEKMVRIEHQQELSKEINENLKKQINDLEAKLSTMIDKPSSGFHAIGVKNLSPIVGETLVFKTIKVNTGGRFDANTGVFTAPVDGMYMFSTQICNYYNRGLQFSMCVNDVKMTNTFHRDDQRSVCTSTNMLADLKAGDRVFVQVDYSTITGQVIYENIHRECMFTGVLVS